MKDSKMLSAEIPVELFRKLKAFSFYKDMSVSASLRYILSEYLSDVNYDANTQNEENVS